MAGKESPRSDQMESLEPLAHAPEPQAESPWAPREVDGPDDDTAEVPVTADEVPATAAEAPAEMPPAPRDADERHHDDTEVPATEAEPQGAAAAPRARGRRARHAIGSSSRHRVIFAGPVGVGKTTAVRALTDIATIDTDVPITDRSGEDAKVAGKTTTTVGIDHGVWKPTADLVVTLLGTPGQDRFESLRGSLLMPHSRVVLWMFADDVDELEGQVRTWLEAIGTPAAYRRMAIALTRTEDGGKAGRTALAPLLAELDAGDTPVMAVDPRDRDSVMRVVSRALDRPEELA